MFLRLIPYLLKNLFRSRTRLAATVIGCFVAGAIASFFLAADHSLDNMLRQTAGSNTLIVKQKDRY